jgi:hypothetical protein
VFLAAEKLHARDALRHGLIDAIANDPLAVALLPFENANAF